MPTKKITKQRRYYWKNRSLWRAWGREYMQRRKREQQVVKDGLSHKSTVSDGLIRE